MALPRERMTSAVPADGSRVSVATLDAPAKINLTLQVLGRRPDGYHNIHSLVIGVELQDRVTCRHSPGGGVEITCSIPELAIPSNLAAKAAVRLASHLGQPCDVQLDIEKAIPVGSGMGGGSSDAAAALRLCNELWNGELGSDELARIGAEVGSDVPLFFALPSAVISGRGEVVRPISLNWSGWILLVFAGIPVSTAEVYRRWRADDCRASSSEWIQAAERATTATELMELSSNDLAPAIFRVAPQVKIAHDRVERETGAAFGITGAGSTLFRLFDDRQAAEETMQCMIRGNEGLSAMVVATPVGTTHVKKEY